MGLSVMLLVMGGVRNNAKLVAAFLPLLWLTTFKAAFSITDAFARGDNTADTARRILAANDATILWDMVGLSLLTCIVILYGVHSSAASRRSFPLAETSA